MAWGGLSRHALLGHGLMLNLWAVVQKLAARLGR